MFGTNFEPINALGPKGGVKVKMFLNSDVATMSRIPLRERVSRNKIHFEQIVVHTVGFIFFIFGPDVYLLPFKITRTSGNYSHVMNLTLNLHCEYLNSS